MDWLRKNLAAAAKKAGRVAAEGLVSVAKSGKSAAVVEINAETDFVSRNPLFPRSLSQVAEIAAKSDYTIETLEKAPFKANQRLLGKKLLG